MIVMGDLNANMGSGNILLDYVMGSRAFGGDNGVMFLEVWEAESF